MNCLITRHFVINNCGKLVYFNLKGKLIKSIYDNDFSFNFHLFSPYYCILLTPPHSFFFMEILVNVVKDKQFGIIFGTYELFQIVQGI